MLASADASYASSLSTGVVMDSAGNLYGSAQYGPNHASSIFEVVKGSSVLTTLASFGGSSTVSPGPLTMDNAGNVYGTTETGGDFGVGTVFELIKGTGVIVTLGTFGSYGPDLPSGRLLIDSAGDLIGTALFDGYTQVFVSDTNSYGDAGFNLPQDVSTRSQLLKLEMGQYSRWLPALTRSRSWQTSTEPTEASQPARLQSIPRAMCMGFQPQVALMATERCLNCRHRRNFSYLAAIHRRRCQCHPLSRHRGQCRSRQRERRHER